MEFLNYMALVKHNNNSISAVTSMASLSTGSMTLIKEVTASSVASIEFINGSSDVVLDNTYPIYKFQFINCHPATDTAYLTFQGSTNSGSSYGVTITSTAFYARHSESGTGAELSYNGSADLAQSTSYQRISQGVGNGNDETCSGELFIYNPSSTTFVKHFMGRMPTYQSSNYIYDQYTGGYFNSTSALDAFDFKFSSGNIDAGTIKLYGIKDS
jgi:hypothetical protein